MPVIGTVSAARAAVDVLADAGGAMTLEDLRIAVEHHLGRPVKAHSLRAALYYHLASDEPWFERPARGRYRLSQAGRSLQRR